MADDRLQNYVQAMEIDPASNKPIPKVVSQIEGGDGLAKLLVNADGSISVSILGADSNGGALKVILDSSNLILPVEVQSVLPKTVQTHAGASVAPSTGNSSVWIDTDGFKSLSLIGINSTATQSNYNIYWSTDGVNTQGAEYSVNSGTATGKGIEVPLKARYVKIEFYNSNTAAVTFTGYAYLKAQ